MGGEGGPRVLFFRGFSFWFACDLLILCLCNTWFTTSIPCFDQSRHFPFGQVCRLVIDAGLDGVILLVFDR